jgi:starch phosphorylase
LPFKEDSGFRDEFMKVKRDNKIYLSNYIKNVLGINIDPESVYDVQIKRLHLYKRQLMNILHVLDIYDRIKKYPHEEVVPQTFIFSAKAAASYRIAKLVIKLINSVANLVNNDPTVAGRIKVVFLENYRVSLAEKLIPAADVSEQISTAGKEASGTGNMKFMLNGAVTIGTLDGANVEIHEEVGDENIFIFGLTVEEVIKMTRENSYSPWDLYNLNQRVRTVLTMLINGTLDPDHDLFREIYESLLNGTDGARADEYFVLKDLDAYADTQVRLLNTYKDKGRWAKMAITNVAKSGKFSSDRTIMQYADEIWGLSPVEIIRS